MWSAMVAGVRLPALAHMRQSFSLPSWTLRSFRHAGVR
jgi:hypothetical protein